MNAHNWMHTDVRMQALVRLMTAQKCIDHNAENRIYFLQPFHIMSVFKQEIFLLAIF